MNESFADSCLTAWLRHRKLLYYYNKPVGICQALFSEKTEKDAAEEKAVPLRRRSLCSVVLLPFSRHRARRKNSATFAGREDSAGGRALSCDNAVLRADSPFRSRIHTGGVSRSQRPRVSLRFHTEVPVCHILCTGGKKRSAKAEGVAKRAAKPLFPPERAQKTPLCTPLPEEPQRNGVPAGTPNKTSHRASPSLPPKKSDTGYPFSCGNNKKGAKRPESPHLNGRPFPSHGRRVSAGEAPPRRPLPTR